MKTNPLERCEKKKKKKYAIQSVIYQRGVRSSAGGHGHARAHARAQ